MTIDTSSISLKLLKKSHFLLLLLILSSFMIEAKFASHSFSPIHGNWANNDHNLVIPTAYLFSDEKFFQNDLVITEYSKIYPPPIFHVLAISYNLTGNMYLGYLTILLGLKLIFVFSTFLLSKFLLKDDGLAFLSTLSLSFTHFMGPEEIGVSEVVAKSFAFAFIPLIFYLFFKYRKFSPLAFLVLGFMIYLHPLTSFPVVLALSFFLYQKKDMKRLGTSLIIFVIVALPFFIDTVHRPSVDIDSFKTVVPYANYENFARTVLKYVPLMIVGFWGVMRKDKKIGQVMTVFVAYALLSVVAIFYESLLPMAFYRASKFIIFFSFIYATFAIFRVWSANMTTKLFVFFLITFPFSSIHYSNMVPGVISQPPSLAVTETENLMKIGVWLDSNTAKETILLAPVEWPALRVWSKRAMVISESDLIVGSVRPEIQEQLRLRYTDVNEVFENPNEESLVAVANKYNARYIVLYDSEIDFPLKFSSGKFNIYEIPL